MFHLVWFGVDLVPCFECLFDLMSGGWAWWGGLAWGFGVRAFACGVGVLFLLAC